MHEHRNQYATVKTIRKLVEVFAVLKEQGPMTLTQLVDTGVVSEQTVYAYKRKGYLAYKGGDNPSEASLLVPGIMPRTGRLDIDVNVGRNVSVELPALPVGDKNTTTDMTPVGVGITSTLEILELLTKIEKHTRKIAKSSKVMPLSKKKRDTITLPATGNANTITVGSNVKRIISAWLRTEGITWDKVEEIANARLGNMNAYTRLAILVNVHHSIINTLPEILQKIEDQTKQAKGTNRT